MTVVSNTSPLLFLAKIDRLGLLPELYGQLVIPEAVVDEVEAKSTTDTDRIRHWKHQSRIEVRPAPVAIREHLPSDLGAGEQGAIALGLDIQSDLVLLDDQEGRRLARRHELAVTGTIGVLVEAHERGAVASLQQELDRLVDAGLWISEAFYERLLEDIDDSP